jgi:tripartite-type tricarboxylate transporter receptor subunit TctC
MTIRGMLQFSVMGLALALSGAVQGQAWPTKPVRMIVPFGTGGGTDIQARLLADSFRQSTGQTFITDNRAGAGGLIGAELAVRSPADGYTILFTTTSLAVNTTLLAKMLKFDPRNDLTPISWVSSTPLVLCTHPSVPAKTAKDLVALAKKSPGKLNNGVNSVGTTSHLAAEMMKQQAGLDLQIIAFKGGGPAIQALMVGDIDLLFATGPVAATNMKTGRIRCLAVTSAKKSSALPDLPTLNTVIPGFQAENWYAMFFPKGAPQEIVNRMNQVIKTALANAKIATFYKREALDGIGSSPAELQALFNRDVTKYAEVIRKGNIGTR